MPLYNYCADISWLSEKAGTLVTLPPYVHITPYYFQVSWIYVNYDHGHPEYRELGLYFNRGERGCASDFTPSFSCLEKHRTTTTLSQQEWCSLYEISNVSLSPWTPSQRVYSPYGKPLTFTIPELCQ